MKHVRHLFVKSTIAVALSAGVLLPQTAAACSADGDYIGSVCYMAGTYCPADDYLPANGQTLNVSEYQALYALIGNIYGGTQNKTFALPDLRGRTAIGSGPLSGTTSVYTPGQKIGQEVSNVVGTGSVTLTASQVPPHTHHATLTLNGVSGTTPVASGAVSLTSLSGSITNLPFSAVASLGVTGIAKIGSSTTTGRSVSLTDKALLTSVGGPSAQIYAPSGTNDRQVGPDGSVTGTASGTVSGTANGGQLSGTASGNISLPVVGAVTVGANATVPAPVTVPVAVSVPVRDPSLVMTACIAVKGYYPLHP
ncbi:phage tail protein [Musicola paradisiaca]|uniref:phage tail protein n=1 Tax=Musicola paradisiaca TaxID=69223 RepID=UPI0003C7F52A|nr:tail fiber protein [Musicola paradisiaca]